MQVINPGWHFADQPEIIEQQTSYFDTDQLTRRGERDEQIGFYEDGVGQGVAFNVWHRTDSGVRGALWDHSAFYLPAVGDVVVGLYYTNVEYSVFDDAERGAMEQGIVQAGILNTNQAGVRTKSARIGRYRYAVFVLRDTFGDAYLYPWGHSERVEVYPPIASLIQIHLGDETTTPLRNLTIPRASTRDLQVRFWRQGDHHDVSSSSLEFAIKKSHHSAVYSMAPVSGTILDAEEGLYEVSLSTANVDLPPGDYVGEFKFTQGQIVDRTSITVRITPHLII